MAFAAHDPLARLSWFARRRWRKAELRVKRQFEAETLGELRELAAGEPVVSWITRPGDHGTVELGGILGPVELAAGGRRIAAKAVWGPTWASLSAAAAQGKVVLAGASRYSGSWLLRFRVLAADSRGVRELPLLGAGLRIVPHSGGEGLRLPAGSPLQPVLV
jgi:hypothetical protein